MITAAASVIGDSDDEDEVGARTSVNRALSPDSEAGGDVTDASDEEGGLVRGNRKRRARSSDSARPAETYDLQELADQGHGGRVLFVFEKIAKARFE